MNTSLTGFAPGPDAARAARMALRSGNFEAAKQLYRLHLARHPGNADALLAISALFREEGKTGVANEFMLRAFAAKPLSAETAGGGKPLVYRTRCLESADYCLVGHPQRGGYKTRFKGGHFSVANLIDKSVLDLRVANIHSGSLAALDNHALPQLLVNTVACADRGRATLTALSGFLRQHPGLPVINHPDAVLRTTRDANFERLNRIDGLRFPCTRRITVSSDPAAQADAILSEGAALPLIVRIAGRQTGRETYLCRDVDEFVRALGALETGADAYVIDFVDCRREDRLYRKARAFFIDGEIHPVACLASDEWQIHSRDRYRLMSGNRALQRQEQAYLADPEAELGPTAWAALGRLGKALGLDFAGVDFTVTPSGELFVFETNAAMRHNFDHVPNFPYTKGPLVRISRAFQAMVMRRLERRAEDDRRPAIAV